MTSLYPDINQVQKFDERVQKLRLNNLMEKEKQIEVKLKHYKKLKRRWNVFKNVFHYSKYPLIVLQYGLDGLLIFIPGTQVIGFVGLGVTTAELIGTNIIEDSLFNVKVKKYSAKCKTLEEYVNKMYVFKQEALKDGVISDHELEQFTKLLQEYEDRLNKINSHSADSKNEKVNLEVQMGEMVKKYVSLHMSQANLRKDGFST